MGEKLIWFHLMWTSPALMKIQRNKNEKHQFHPMRTWSTCNSDNTRSMKLKDLHGFMIFYLLSWELVELIWNNRIKDGEVENEEVWGAGDKEVQHIKKTRAIKETLRLIQQQNHGHDEGFVWRGVCLCDRLRRFVPACSCRHASFKTARIIRTTSECLHSCFQSHLAQSQKQSQWHQRAVKASPSQAAAQFIAL